MNDLIANLIEALWVCNAYGTNGEVNKEKLVKEFYNQPVRITSIGLQIGEEEEPSTFTKAFITIIDHGWYLISTICDGCGTSYSSRIPGDKQEEFRGAYEAARTGSNRTKNGLKRLPCGNLCFLFPILKAADSMSSAT